MGIEDRIESTRDRVEELERETGRLTDRVQAMEAILAHIAKERHDAAVESRGFMRGHSAYFDVCGEAVCASVRSE